MSLSLDKDAYYCFENVYRNKIIKKKEMTTLTLYSLGCKKKRNKRYKILSRNIFNKFCFFCLFLFKYANYNKK